MINATRMHADAGGVTAALPTNTQLVSAALAGSEAAWAAIVDRFQRLVWKVVRGFRLDAAAAEDVVQLTWIRLVENLARVRDPERLAGWLATTARNEALAVVRRRQRTVPVAEVPETGDMAGWFDEDRIVAAEEHTLVARAFAELDDDDRELLLLLTGDPPLSYAEAANVLQRPIGSIGPSRGRALRRLRRTITAESLRSGIGTGGGSSRTAAAEL